MNEWSVDRRVGRWKGEWMTALWSEWMGGCWVCR